jgi:hypothetical protein
MSVEEFQRKLRELQALTQPSIETLVKPPAEQIMPPRYPRWVTLWLGLRDNALLHW